MSNFNDEVCEYYYSSSVTENFGTENFGTDNFVTENFGTENFTNNNFNHEDFINRGGIAAKPAAKPVVSPAKWTAQQNAVQKEYSACMHTCERSRVSAIKNEQGFDSNECERNCTKIHHK